MAFGTYTIEVDWLGDGAFTASNDDVTNRVFSARWERGRDFASQLTGRSVASLARIVLDNESGDYNSFNTSSPLDGSLLPGRRMRILVDDGLGSSTAWFGYLNEIRPAPRVKDVNTVELVGIGPLGHVNRKSVSISMQTSVTASALIGTILTQAGWTAGTDVDSGQTTFDRVWFDKQKTLSALRIVEATENGFLTESKNGTIKFEDRHHRLTASHLTATATFDDAAGAALTFNAIRQEDPIRFIYNEFETSIRNYSTAATAILWTHPGTGSTAFSLDIGEKKTVWASYPNPDSTLNAFAVDSWTTLSATLDYGFNSQVGGGGTVLDADIAITTSFFSTSMKIVMENTGTQLAFPTKLEARGVPLFRSDPVLVSVEDAVSQTTFGERTFRNRSEFVPDTNEANSWGLYNLGVSKDPQPILSLSFIANKDATHLQAMQDRDISDRIRVIATGSSGLGINEDFFIEHESHQVNRARTHAVTYKISAAAGYSGFWVLGISALGQSTRLAY